jgi:uncharacterized protein YndB with AHSA1/START domain
MAEVKIERILKADPETVFAFVSKGEHLVKWWGPEGMTLPDAHLDFTKPGPWHSVMQNAEGQNYKVSGQVTSVEAPHKIGFTWAWHDDKDQRGDESHVTLTVAAHDGGGTKFTLHHQQLPTQDSADNHTHGWTSSLKKLERLAN